jgi:hypothetical protein
VEFGLDHYSPLPGRKMLWGSFQTRVFSVKMETDRKELSSDTIPKNKNAPDFSRAFEQSTTLPQKPASTGFVVQAR